MESCGENWSDIENVAAALGLNIEFMRIRKDLWGKHRSTKIWALTLKSLELFVWLNFTKSVENTQNGPKIGPFSIRFI